MGHTHFKFLKISIKFVITALITLMNVIKMWLLLKKDTGLKKTLILSLNVKICHKNVLAVKISN